MKTLLTFLLVLITISGFSQATVAQNDVDINSQIYTNGVHAITGAILNPLMRQLNHSYVSLYGNTGNAAYILGFTDATPLRIRTNNVERMRILSTGEVGIGTTTPTKTFQVAGYAGYASSIARADSLQFLDSAMASKIKNINSWNIGGNSGTTAGTNFIGTTDNKNLIFKRNNHSAISLTLDGTNHIIDFIDTSWFLNKVIIADGTQGANKVLTSDANGVGSWQAGGWSLTGNTGTTAGTNFIGTTDNTDFEMKRNSALRFQLSSASNLFWYKKSSTDSAGISMGNAGFITGVNLFSTSGSVSAHDSGFFNLTGASSILGYYNRISNYHTTITGNTQKILVESTYSLFLGITYAIATHSLTVTNATDYSLMDRLYNDGRYAPLNSQPYTAYTFSTSVSYSVTAGTAQVVNTTTTACTCTVTLTLPPTPTDGQLFSFLSAGDISAFTVAAAVPILDTTPPTSVVGGQILGVYSKGILQYEYIGSPLSKWIRKQ